MPSYILSHPSYIFPSLPLPTIVTELHVVLPACCALPPHLPLAAARQPVPSAVKLAELLLCTSQFTLPSCYQRLTGSGTVLAV